MSKQKIKVVSFIFLFKKNYCHSDTNQVRYNLMYFSLFDLLFQQKFDKSILLQLYTRDVPILALDLAVIVLQSLSIS